MQAQPVPPGPVAKGTNSFSPELKESISDLLEFSAQDRVCRRVVDLHVENATLAQVIARLKQILPTGMLHVEVSGATPIKVSLDLKQVRVGDALSDLARLAGCKLYILPDTLLIVPEPQLSPAQLHAVSDYNGNGAEWLREGTNWSFGSKAKQLFTRAVAQEATGQNTTTDVNRGLTPGTIQTTFGAFSPESQLMLRELAIHLNESIRGYVPQQGRSVFPVFLTGDTPIIVSIPNPGQITITFPPNPLDPSASDSKSIPRSSGIGWYPR